LLTSLEVDAAAAATSLLAILVDATMVQQMVQQMYQITLLS
jgi:hypothetical protein